MLTIPAANPPPCRAPVRAVGSSAGWRFCLRRRTARPAFAQNAGDYPARPIHFIIPNTVGGTSDILARMIGARLSDAMGQPVIVESQAGAAGRIALDYMAKAAPDGYTILLGNNGTNAIVPSAQAATPPTMPRSSR